MKNKEKYALKEKKKKQNKKNIKYKKLHGCKCVF